MRPISHHVVRVLESSRDEPTRAVATGFLTVDEAAAYLGLSSKTVLRAYRGEGPYRAHPLPGYKPSPRVLRFTTADIDAWLRSAVAPRTPSEYTGTGRLRARRSA
jgi:excisionase family DNA binding protein